MFELSFMRVAALAVLSILCFTVGSIAQTAPPANASTSPADVFLDYAKQLREENKQFAEHLEKQEESHQKFMEGLYDKAVQFGGWVVGIMAGLFAILGAIVGFLHWKTYRDIQSQIQKAARAAEDKFARENVEREVEEFQAKLEEEFQEAVSKIRQEARRDREIDTFVSESLVGLGLVARGNLNPLETERVAKIYEKGQTLANRYSERRELAIQLARWHEEYAHDLDAAIGTLDRCFSVRRKRKMPLDPDDGALRYNTACCWNTKAKSASNDERRVSARSKAQEMIDEALRIDPNSREEAQNDSELDGLSR